MKKQSESQHPGGNSMGIDCRVILSGESMAERIKGHLVAVSRDSARGIPIVAPDSPELDLAGVEKMVNELWRDMIATGQALRTAKERKLYAPQHKSVGEFLKGGTPFNSGFVERLTTVAEVIEDLKGSFRAENLPRTLDEIEELAKLKRSHRARVWWNARYASRKKPVGMRLLRKLVSDKLQAETMPLQRQFTLAGSEIAELNRLYYATAAVARELRKCPNNVAPEMKHELNELLRRVWSFSGCIRSENHSQHAAAMKHSMRKNVRTYLEQTEGQ